MSELVKNYAVDKNLGPVKVAYFERVEDGKTIGVEGFEVSFRESAPEMRNRFLWYFLLVLIFAMGIPFLALLEPVTTIMWIGLWVDGELDGDQKFIAYAVLAGSACFIVLFYMMKPPFRGDVVVTISPADDRVGIRRGGKLAHDLALTESREVVTGPHPGLETAQLRAENNPSRAMKKHVTTYRQVESVSLIMGQTRAMNMVEIASVMGDQASRRNLAMTIRATLDGCLQAGKKIQSDMARRPVAKKPLGDAPEPIIRRRRRDKN
jgi:hypothetical protein